jgi:hypothetical protein
MTGAEGLTLSEAVEWCGEEISVREATRLRRLASEPQADDGDQGGDGAALATAGSGGAGAGSSAG